MNFPNCLRRKKKWVVFGSRDQEIRIFQNDEGLKQPLGERNQIQELWAEGSKNMSNKTHEREEASSISKSLKPLQRPGSQSRLELWND